MSSEPSSRESAAAGRTARELPEPTWVPVWPRSSLKEADALIAHLLAQAAGVLRAPRLLLVWEELDEPWLHLAHLSDAGVERLREPPTAFEPLVHPSLAGASFFTAGDARGAWCNSAAGLRHSDCAPLHAGLARRFAVERAASWPLAGESVEGRLFALDISRVDGDGAASLLLGEIVAGRVAAELDSFYLTERLRSAAVADERLRVAWDLHDGLLQSLAGAALQLQVLTRLLEDDPPAAREQLAEIQRLIAADQRDLRFYIEELKPGRAEAVGEGALAERLAELGERLKRLAGLDVEVRLEGLDGPLPEFPARQLYQLLREALFNVARHAGARAVQVEVRRRGAALEVAVSDDGRGFPFHGRYEHADLARGKLGPVSLKERITALGGSLAIDSAPGRTRLEMRLPLGEAR
jgi:signal transduction histidine kinase